MKPRVPLRPFALALLGCLLNARGAEAVVFFTEPNIQGEALRVEAGARVEDLATLRRANQQPWRGAISSVQIEGTARATVAMASAASPMTTTATATMTSTSAISTATVCIATRAVASST